MPFIEVNYIKSYINTVSKNINAIIDVYNRFKIPLVSLETNLAIGDSSNMDKTMKILKIVKNTLDKGDTYYVSIIPIFEKKEVIFSKVIIKTVILKIKKNYHIELEYDQKYINAKITINEIEDNEYRVEFPKVFDLGYSIYKRDKTVNLINYIDSIEWKNYDINFMYLLSNINYKDIFAKYADMTKSQDNKLIELDSESIVKITYFLLDPLTEFNKKIDEFTSYSTQYKIILNDEDKTRHMLSIMISANNKYYYLSYSFKQVTEHNENELRTICYTRHKYKLIQVGSYNDFGYLRNRRLFKLLKGNNSSSYLDGIYFNAINIF